MKIIVYRIGNLGDTVCAIPAFRLIREHYPHAELILLCDQPRAGTVGVGDVIDSLHIFDRIETYRSGTKFGSFWRLTQLIRKLRPDCLIGLAPVREPPLSLRAKDLFFRACGIRDVRGFKEHSQARFPHLKEPERLIRLLGCCKIDGAKPPYAIPVNAAAQSTVIKRLESASIDVSAGFMVFCGGGKTPVQRWPLERYAVVLDAVKASIHLPIVALGSPQETAYYQEIMGAASRQLVFPNAPFSLPEMFELLRMATVYIGNDTGPMHAAAAVGCPVAVVISARAAPGAWYPDVDKSLVFRSRVPCQNCSLSECIAEKHRCMLKISATHVLEKLLPFLHALPIRRGKNLDPERTAPSANAARFSAMQESASFENLA